MKFLAGGLFILGVAATFASQVKHPKLDAWRDALAWLGFTLGSASQTGRLVPARIAKMMGPKLGKDDKTPKP